MAEHSILSPSSAEMWINCSASLLAGKGIKRIESQYAEEGTEAHAMACKCLRENVSPEQIPGVDPEMIDPVSIYVKNVRKMTKKALWKTYEEPLNLSKVLDFPDQIGTGDCLAIVGHELQVHDLKYGKGIAVSATENPQLKLYALGALEIAELISDTIKKIRLVIHQPRLSEEPNEWETSVDDLKLFGMVARTAAKTAMRLYETGVATDSDFNPGKKQCQWCPAKASCKYLAKFCTNEVLADFDDLTVKPATPSVALMTPQQIARVLVVGDLITNWLKAVDKRALGMLLNNEPLPGYKLVEGRMDNREWTDEAKVIEKLKSYRLSADEMYEMKLITPTKAEKTLSNIRWQRIEHLVTRKPGAKQVVPESDKRPAVIPGTVEAEFENLNQQEG